MKLTRLVRYPRGDTWHVHAAGSETICGLTLFDVEWWETGRISRVCARCRRSLDLDDTLIVGNKSSEMA